MKWNKVSVSYDIKPVLQAVDLEWKEGERIAVFGANGTGKTTLLKVAALLQKPTDGKIETGIRDRDWKRKLGIVFQESFLLDKMTVTENLSFYQKLYGVSDEKAINELLWLVALGKVAHEEAGKLSKGMKQRLSIARALVHRPDRLLLDEPFDGLDVYSRRIIARLLNEGISKDVGWLLVTHDIRQSWTICDRAILLHRGKVIEDRQCEEGALEAFERSYQSCSEEAGSGIF